MCDGDGTSCLGCTDSDACNYDETATIDDETCLYNDVCGICDGDSYAGCTDPAACNYDAGAAATTVLALMTDWHGATVAVASSQKDVSTLNLSSTDVNWTVLTRVSKAASKTEAWWCSSRTTPLFNARDGASLVVGTWSYDECLCAAGMDALLIELYCHSIAKHSSWPWTVTVSSARSDLDECDCVGVEDHRQREYFCSDRLLGQT